MASATAMASASLVVAAPVSLSSSAAFGGASQMVHFAPVSSVASGRVGAVRASYSGDVEETSVTRKVLSSVVATGLAITLAGSAFAAAGPGGDGAERTARKADELLKGADALIKNDSPQRFGPERGFGNGTDKADEDRFSRKAGGGPIPEIQDVTSAQVSGARDKFASNVDKSKRRIDGIWGLGKGLQDVAATTQGKVDDATKGAKKVFGQATKNSNVASNAASDLKGKADEVAAPVKSNSGGFFGKIKQQVRGVQGAVAKAGSNVQGALPK